MAEFREVMRKMNEICATYDCRNCPISTCITMNDEEAKKFEEVVLKYSSEVDWSKVEVDTPILVKEHKNQEWAKKYFAKYEDGKVYAYCGGGTSWSCEISVPWKYAKIWRGEE